MYFSFTDEIQISSVEYHLTIAELVIGISNSEKFGSPEYLPAMIGVAQSKMADKLKVAEHLIVFVDVSLYFPLIIVLRYFKKLIGSSVHCHRLCELHRIPFKAYAHIICANVCVK